MRNTTNKFNIVKYSNRNNTAHHIIPRVRERNIFGESESERERKSKRDIHTIL